MVDRVEGDLRFEPDTVTVLPLEERDPRARFQQTIEVRAVDDIIDFGFVRAWDFSRRERADLLSRMRDNEDLRRRGAFLADDAPLTPEEFVIEGSAYFAPKFVSKDFLTRQVGTLYAGVVFQIVPTLFFVPAGATVELTQGLN